MKKKSILGLLAIAAIIIFCGFQYSSREGAEIPGKQQMEILHFHGHSYICYRFCEKSSWADRSYGFGGASIVHDPDCKCHNTKKK